MFRRAAVSIAALAALSIAAPVAGAGSAARGSGKNGKSKRWTSKLDQVAGGRHWRIDTHDRGPIHVWVPRGYRRKSAGLVVYLHGDGVNADQAWEHHRLAEQFRRSKQNAMFVVPEAPIDGDDPVKWPELGKLRRALARKGGFRIPAGHQVVIGHSRAYVTMSNWLDNKRLHQVIVLDGFYGSVQAKMLEYIHSGKRARHHRMVIVARDTYGQAAAFVRRFKWAAIHDRVPARLRKLPKRARRSRLLLLRSQYSHGDIVKLGKVIPLVLQVSPLRRVR
jgi:hypothetical protein